MNAAATIVPLTPDALDPVSAIEKEAGDVGWSGAQFEKELSLAMSRFFVLREGHNILGYGGYWKVTDEAQITNMVILPSERRQGKGHLLLQHLMDHARTEGCCRMTLEVRGHNLAAQALYQKTGFAVQGRRPQAYSNPMDDAILMEKLL